MLLCLTTCIKFLGNNGINSFVDKSSLVEEPDDVDTNDDGLDDGREDPTKELQETEGSKEDKHEHKVLPGSNWQPVSGESSKKATWPSIKILSI
jgi:hypothetical protein